MNAARRWLAAAACGAVATVALLLAVQALVAPHAHSRLASAAPLRIELLRVPADSETRERRRRTPEPPPEPATARPAAAPASPPALPQPAVATRLSDVEVRALPDADLLIGADVGGVLGDLDVVPLVRVPPEYPARAAQRGIHGWVHLEFTVTASGSVEDVRVVESSPPGIFDRAAVRAAKRFKYRPRMREGRPVERPGVQLLMRFDADPS